MVAQKVPQWSAEPFVPTSRSLAALQKAALVCTGCPLYQDTTQTVFGAGSRDADIILVGEQPGDQEDKQGEPFVGPAGRVLWRCVEKAQLDPQRLYITNAVKHFKHETRGKRRLHKKPTTLEAEACHPWLEAELEAVRANVVVALGAVAARPHGNADLGDEERGRDLRGRRKAGARHVPPVCCTASRGGGRGDSPPHRL